MDYKTDLISNPDLALELLAVAVKRAGGVMAFAPEDTLPPYNLFAVLLSDDAGNKHLTLNYREEVTGNC